MTVLKEITYIHEITEKENQIVVRGEKSLTSSQLNKELIEKGIVVSHLTTIKKSLEEQFLEILSENNV